MKVCPECGYTTDNDETLCPKCDTPLDDIESDEENDFDLGVEDDEENGEI
jgi:uncharacterized membrane protein YvbJ